MLVMIIQASTLHEPALHRQGTPWRPRGTMLTRCRRRRWSLRCDAVQNLLGAHLINVCVPMGRTSLLHARIPLSVLTPALLV
jgi:hypothetical protein